MSRVKRPRSSASARAKGHVRLMSKALLVGEQQVMHVPELALRASRLGGKRSAESSMVNLGEREVPECEPQVVRQHPLQLLHHAMGGATERALVVAVLDERDRRGMGPLNVVALVHRDGEPRCVE